jgi:hypothetical protein
MAFRVRISGNSVSMRDGGGSMLRLTIALLTLAFAATASAGWRDLRVDGSSADAFAKSLDVFKEELSAPRQYVFGEALKDIWVVGAKKAEAEQRDYTADEYYAQLDGLTYEEVVTLTDPTGETAKKRYDEASRTTRGGGMPGPNLPAPNPGDQELRTQAAHRALDAGVLMRGRTTGGETCGGSGTNTCGRPTGTEARTP